MPSHADRRGWGEWVLRGLVIGVLAWSLWRAFSATRARDDTLGASSASLNDALHRALTTPGVAELELSLTSTPSRRERDVLAALRRAGTRVRWNGSVAPMAIE